MFPLEPPSTIHDAPFENVTTMRDVPDKAGREMTVGEASLHRALPTKSRVQEAYQAHMRDLDQEINWLRWSDNHLAGSIERP
jgi:hypothetical protein